MADLGVFGIVFPEEWGGSGGDFTSLCIAIEEIGRSARASASRSPPAVGLGANPIHSFGNARPAGEWLPDLVAGRRLGAFGLTEPDAGSDAGGTRTRARYDDGQRRMGARTAARRSSPTRVRPSRRSSP
jgi:short/branched chain acyl-CoA dehydrogenase